jgi:inhibitor of cysteine peptidase
MEYQRKIRDCRILKLEVQGRLNRFSSRVIGVWLAVLASCGPPDLPTATTVEVDDSHNGNSISLSLGQILVVSLEANPTTGYTWEVDDIDVSMLNQLGEAQFQPESEAIGAGGTQTYYFRAIAEGQTDLSLAYLRPWEQRVTPLRTFILHVQID